MAVFALIEKVEEDERRVRYKFSGAEGVERFLVLDKEEKRTWPEDGREDIQYRAVAMKVAVAWAKEGVAADRLTVAS
jgi:hypothetical protein